MPLEHKNCVSMIHGPDAPEALRDPQITPDAKTQVRCIVSRRVFCEIHTGPT
jgi:hypothetical protein